MEDTASFISLQWEQHIAVRDSNVRSLLVMIPKCSPVRYTIPTLEQPVPENKKVQRNAF